MKKLFCIGALTLALTLMGISCTSTSIVPGEDKARLANISSEYYFIATSYENLKNYSKAIEYYKLARSNAEIRNACDYGAARCYAYQKDWENALGCYKKLLDQDPMNTNLKLSVAYINAVSGNLDQARKQYEELNESGVDQIGVYKNYVSVLVVIEKYDDAKTVLAQMEEKYPEAEAIETLKKKIDEALNPPEENTEVEPENEAVSK